MSDIQGILSKAGKLIDLPEATNVLNKIAELRTHWEVFSGLLTDLGKPMTLDQWVETVITGIESDDVTKIFTDAGLADSHTALKSWLDKVDEDTRDTIITLLKPLNGDFGAGGDSLDFPLFSISESLPSGADAPWSLSLGAKAGLELEALADWPYPSDNVEEDLLALRLSLSADAEAKAKLPVQFGSVSAEGSVKKEFGLAYYHQPNDLSVPFALAAAKSLKETINPFSFDSVWRRLNSPESGAFGLTLDYKGNLQLSVGLSIATMFENSMVDIAPSVKLAASVKRPVEASLSLRRGNPVGLGHSVIMTMTRKKSFERRFSASAGLVVDLSKSADVLHGVLKERLDKWEKGFEDIKPFLSPGTYVRDQLSAELGDQIAALIKDPDLAAALKSDASLVLGLDSKDESALTEWLEKLVTDKIDTFGGDYLSKKEEAIKQVANQVLAELPLINVLGGQAQEKVNTAIGSLFNKILPKLRGKITSLFNSVSEEANKQIDLGKELKRIGSKTDKKIQEIDDLTKGVSEVIETYFARFRSLLELLEDKAKTTLTAEIDIEDVLENGVNFEFSGEFVAPTVEAGELYASLIAGGYQAVEAQVHDGVRTPGFVLDIEKTKIGRFTRRERNWGFKVSLFGMTLGGREKLRAKVETVAAADGKLSVDATGLAQRTLSKKKDTRKFDFLSDVSLMHTKAAAGASAQRLFEETLAFNMVYNEHRMDRDEVAAFLSDLAEAPFIPSSLPATPGFISKQAIPLALNRVDKWIANPGANARLSGQLELRLTFNSAAVAKQLDQQQHSDSDLFDMMMRQFARNGAYDQEDWDEFLKFLKRDVDSETLAKLSGPEETRDYKVLFGHKIKKWHGHRKPGPRRQNRPTLKAFKHDRVRWLFIRAQAFPDFVNAARMVYHSPIGDNGEFDRRALRRHVAAKDAAIMKIVSLGAGEADEASEFGEIFKFKDGITGRTIAFLQMLNHIFSASEPKLVAVIKSTSGEKVIDQFVVA